MTPPTASEALRALNEDATRILFVWEAADRSGVRRELGPNMAVRLHKYLAALPALIEVVEAAERTTDADWPETWLRIDRALANLTRVLTEGA